MRPSAARLTLLAMIGLAFSCLLVMAAPGDGPKVGTLPVGKVVFLGNSITLHGPAPSIGWTGDWGMAASSREKDYVHRLMDLITREAGVAPKVKIRNIADFERNQTDYNIGESLKEELAFEPDVVILAIGENAPSPKTDEARKRFSDALDNLLAQLRRHGNPRIFVRGEFWPDADKDRLFKKASEAAGCIYVDIEKLGTDPSNAASSERKIEHAGVAAHPGDKGMAAIADALWLAIKQAGQPKP